MRFWSRNPGSPGRERLLGVLRQRYDDDITAFNTVYGEDFKTFDELITNGSINYPKWVDSVKMGHASLPNRIGADRMSADAEALLGELVEQVYKLAYTEIRKHDPNHMILGCYVKDWTYTREIWERVAPFVSVLAPQNLSAITPIKPIVQDLGMPAVLGDQEFGNVYALPLQGQSATPGAVPDHLDRRVMYDLLANRIACDPDFIGVSFCACLFDQSHWNSSYDRGQPGFFSINGESKTDLVKTVQSANALMLASVRQPREEESIAKLHRAFLETKNAYQHIMRERKQLLQKNQAKN